MLVDNVRNLWAMHFGENLPFFYLLRSIYQDRWVRIHSLPGSKRYPDTKEEYDTILERHNIILRALTNGKPCHLISSSYSDKPEQVSDCPIKLDAEACPWVSTYVCDESDPEDNPFYWHTFISEWQYKPGIFDQVLKLVIDDEVGDTIIFGGLENNSPWIFYPYDGGIDLILETPEKRDQIKANYSEWLSPRPDGL